MKRILVMLAGMAVALNAQATVLLNIDAEALKNSAGTRIAEGSGLVLVVADTTNNGFVGTINQGSSLALSGFLNGGDDQIIARFGVTSGGFGAGDFEVSPSLTLAGGWNAGDAIALYWFSNATLSDLSAAAGMMYNGNAATTTGTWTTPADTGAQSMSWLTTDAVDLGTGTVPAANGNTSLTVVPEPSTITLLGLGLLGALALRRRS